ncbi:membrane protein insertion efficiency factor YidD [Hyphococcus flavus]|uniref:Putative membrane protein insertion efficiency factor n=1 Tax=Hyphococcus flavus TaxID=1866326 RepID=A0AAE9ZL08_9PROT|nr:membrane protein insertion efficiency factor YidD [Hyphococcus flavus]WDI32580.1 membrane protein insertion efficiency factor YidD [Hyphococcus flavus]
MQAFVEADLMVKVKSGPGGRAVMGAIWLYRRSLSPMLYALGVRCRHTPSCSQYAAEAFASHRFKRAFWLSVSRFLRCHPFGSHGFDPVPKDQPDVGWKFWKLGDWAWTERNGTQDGASSNEKSGSGEPLS